jgi:hypothetical protein
VNRSQPESLEPECFDPEASATIMPMEVRRTTGGWSRAAEKLNNDWDMMIRGEGTVTAPPPATEAERLAGFFIIRANDRGAALEVARTCPHLRYGGSILIREIERT